ncbi:tRNA lysidine(34) synthetase TilS [Corynebacterium kroppenstedtii]|uniref:tRNA lysidine(34) synthetase TilS n=1 Tax=Corynebacterium sp. PCR 32 TaxID=3351342 RepID=UPI0030A6B049
MPRTPTSPGISGASTPAYTPPGTKPGPHVLRIRHALTEWKTAWDTAPDSPRYAARPTNDMSCVIGCSGGADSLALVGCAVSHGWDIHAVVVDHGLQDGSDDVATRTAHVCRMLGATADTVRVYPRHATEAAARHARYHALGTAAHARGGLPVLVAHTGDDQVESLFLGLARGSGLGSIAGMSPISWAHPATDAGAAALGRPLLRVRRDNTLGACTELGITPWHDPTNTSGTNLRSRVRTEIIPRMRDVLGAAAIDNAVTTAAMIRTDEDYLTHCASQALTQCSHHDTLTVDVDIYRRQPPALRGRIIKQWLSRRAGPLTRAHVDAIDALATHWHGQGGVAIPWPQSPAPPGRLIVVRRHHNLIVTVDERRKLPEATI